jgi:hypothetical protein
LSALLALRKMALDLTPQTVGDIAVHASVKSQKNFLSKVYGQFRVAQQPVSQAIDNRKAAPVDGIEGIGVGLVCVFAFGLAVLLSLT